MALWDTFFKNKNNRSSKNFSLADLLYMAINEPAYRATFYKRLLSDNLVILTGDVPSEESSKILSPGTKVDIVSLPDGTIPIFTSTERIFDNNIIKEPVGYMSMKGKDLFELAVGASFILNPYSDSNKQITAEEVGKLLSGDIFRDNTKRITIEKKTSVQIGQPSKYPDEIVSSLKVLFARKADVRAAYLGWIYDPKSEEPPHYVFGLDTDGNYNELLQEAGFTVQQYLNQGDIADFIQISGNEREGLAAYLISTTPFYAKDNLTK